VTQGASDGSGAGSSVAVRFRCCFFPSAKVNRVPRATRGSTDIARDRLFDRAQLAAQALERRERQHVFAAATPAAAPSPAAAHRTRRRRRGRQRRLTVTAPLPLLLLLLLLSLLLRLLLALLVRLHVSDVRFRDELVSAPLARWICCCRRRCGSREKEGTATKDARDRVEHCVHKS